MALDLTKVPVVGGVLNSLFEPRSEGQYAGVDQGNYQLPGFQARSDRDNALGAQYGLRGAPQASDSAFWSGQQRGLADRLGRQASGQDSYSALALQQGQGQLQNQQLSMMAGSAPQNMALAQRQAMQNTARGQQGLASQQAMAGIAERNAATQALMGLSGQARGQDNQMSQFNVGAQLQQTGMNDQASAGAYNRELTGAGMQQGGMMGYETQRGQRAVGQLGAPTQGEEILGTAMGAAQLAYSDERVKTGARSGGRDANSFMESLNPRTYQYKPGYGAPGPHTGIMAQDLERNPVGRQAVTDTPRGKVVDYGQLGGIMTASLGALHDRLKRVEGPGRRGPGAT